MVENQRCEINNYCVKHDIKINRWIEDMINRKIIYSFYHIYLQLYIYVYNIRYKRSIIRSKRRVDI